MTTMIVNVPEKEKSLFLALLKKFQFKSKVVSEEDKEDYGLLKAMMEGETGEYIDTDLYIKKLRKK